MSRQLQWPKLPKNLGEKLQNWQLLVKKQKEVPFQQERLQKTTNTDGKKEKKSLHMYTRPGHLWFKYLKLINKEQTSLNICLKEEMIQW